MINIKKGKYLIAGATGLIGSSIVKRLANKEGVEVVGIHNKTEPFINGKNIKYYSIDLSGESLFYYEDKITDVDFLIMTAGTVSSYPVLSLDPVCHIIKNIKIGINLCKFAYATKIKNISLISSAVGYSHCNCDDAKEEYFFKDNPPVNYFSVGWAARCIEKQCEHLSFGIKDPIKVTILRPTTVYGEKEGFDCHKCHMLPKMVKKIYDSESNLKIECNSETRRDMIYSDDLVDAILISLYNNGSIFEEYNVGSGVAYSFREMSDIIKKYSKKQNLNIKFEICDVNEKSLTLSLSKINKINFKAKTTIEEGIKKLVTECKRSKNH